VAGQQGERSVDAEALQEGGEEVAEEARRGGGNYGPKEGLRRGLEEALDWDGIGGEITGQFRAQMAEEFAGLGGEF
jgi:hypothetical protein